MMGKCFALPLLAVFICVADQVSKIYMTSILEIGQSIEVIPGYFNFTLVMNPGAAFGLFANLPSTIRRILLGVVTAVAMTLVILLLRKEAKEDQLAKIALFMVIGGAVGNLIDRFRYDAVVDFLDVYWGSYHWPAFNIADSAISIAVVILLLRFAIKPAVNNSESELS